MATFPKQGTLQPDSHIKFLTEVQRNINAMPQRAATNVLLSTGTSVPRLSSVRRELALCLALSLALQTEAACSKAKCKQAHKEASRYLRSIPASIEELQSQHLPQGHLSFPSLPSAPTSSILQKSCFLEQRLPRAASGLYRLGPGGVALLRGTI